MDVLVVLFFIGQMYCSFILVGKVYNKYVEFVMCLFFFLNFCVYFMNYVVYYQCVVNGIGFLCFE